MKKKLLILLVAMLVMVSLWLFRTFIFKGIITYTPIQYINKTKPFIKNSPVLNEIDTYVSKQKSVSVEKLIKISADITANHLSFKLSIRNNELLYDPNQIYKHKVTNCIGYATFYNAVLSMFIKKLNLTKDVQVKHVRGKQLIFGFDFQKFKWIPPAFDDHDYNLVIYEKNNKKQMVFLDTNLFDYTGILFVKGPAHN